MWFGLRLRLQLNLSPSIIRDSHAHRYHLKPSFLVWGGHRASAPYLRIISQHFSGHRPCVGCYCAPLLPSSHHSRLHSCSNWVVVRRGGLRCVPPLFSRQRRDCLTGNPTLTRLTNGSARCFGRKLCSLS